MTKHCRTTNQHHVWWYQLINWGDKAPQTHQPLQITQISSLIAWDWGVPKSEPTLWSGQNYVHPFPSILLHWVILTGIKSMLCSSVNLLIQVIINPIYKQSVMMRQRHNMLAINKWPHHIARNACIKGQIQQGHLRIDRHSLHKCKCPEILDLLISHIASSNVWDSMFVVDNAILNQYINGKIHQLLEYWPNSCDAFSDRWNI